MAVPDKVADDDDDTSSAHRERIHFHSIRIVGKGRGVTSLTEKNGCLLEMDLQGKNKILSFIVGMYFNGRGIGAQWLVSPPCDLLGPFCRGYEPLMEGFKA
ncbi:hypothetical protein PoB_007362600 [Plakobranchus ocellatus]|uniref:Uncharacterized protein n=1 Tax=Plakobranchus ocellatus TaxID=259542 RepID=A0AAV4DSR2_9GAST|nr:hypothetical protein PoB_007362600 [Plakobranchus ocellatus]